MRKTKLLSLACSVLVGLAAHCAYAQGVEGKEVLHWSGDASNRYDLVIVGEGFTSDELDTFRRQANTALAQMRSTSPYTEYMPYINVIRLDYAAPQSGITEKGVKDVNSGFGTVYAPDSMNYLRVKPSRIKRLVASQVNDVDAILCIMNGAAGGRSYGKVCVASNIRMAYGDNVCVHELGHTIGRNGDEYNNTDIKIPGFLSKIGESIARPLLPLYYGFEFLNVTAQTKRKKIPWKHWIDESVAVPTDLSDGRTGLYEGALYQKRNWYRPVPNCMMRHGTRHCAPCGERIVLKINEKVVPHTFTHETVGGVTEASIETIVPGPLRTKWFLDGRMVARGKTTVRINSEAMSKRKQTLVVEVQDATAQVRKDSDRILVHHNAWKLKKKDGKVSVRKSSVRKQRKGILGWFQSIFNPLKGDWPEYRQPPEGTVDKAIIKEKPPTRKAEGAAAAIRKATKH